jgi:AAHS family 4-hydroxybenzoate transporter-like MFS transporter
MPGDRVFDVDQFLDTRKLNATHVKIIALLVLTMLIDGYDIFVTGYVLPVLAKGLHVKPHAFTSVFVLQQFGLLVGTIFMGPLADRFGRKTTLLFSIACFSVCSLLTTQVHTVAQFTVIRVISSVFFSGVIPNAIALASEMAPKKMRAAAVSITFCGYTGGSFIGSFVQAFILDPFGWQGAFWIGGLLPIAIFAVLLWQLPESVRFRARRNPNDPRIAKVLRQLDPTVRLDGSEIFLVHEPARMQGRAPAAALFQGRFLILTALLWVAYAMGFLVSHLLGSWNTTVLNTVAGIPMKNLSVVIAGSALAGVVGTAVSGLFMDRFGPIRALPAFFVGNAIALAVLSLSDVHSPVMTFLFMAVGFFNAASLGGINALAAITYPSSIRGTGVAWAAGAGRAGAMFGPMFGGFMLGHHFGITPIYLTTAVPALIAAGCLIAMSRVRAPTSDLPVEEVVGQTTSASLMPDRPAA